MFGAVAAPLASATRRTPTVPTVLAQLWHSGAISEAVYKQDSAVYSGAEKSLGKLRGTRHTELGAVLANLRAITAAGELSASRTGALFLTLEHNWHWWTSEPLLSNGERVSFAPSKIVWEYYAGQGIEIQWLGTFGEANGYYLSGHENSNLRQLLGEVLPLATQRAGGIAWEYMFRFDGGSPPWTSGLSQGTALQVLARAWSRFKEAPYLTAAQQALGIFKTSPSSGVRVKTSAGAMYAEYTYAPSDRILNGFIQALVGLYDYAQITKDPTGLALFDAGDAEARAEVPRYNTGAWSMYDQFGESNLNYHELLTEFLQHLCERTRKGEPLTLTPAPATTAAPAPAGTNGNGGTEPTGPTGTTGSASLGASAARARSSAAAAVPVTPIAADAIYCTTAQQFTADLHTPPVVSLMSTTLPASARAGVQLSLSKISTVSLTIRQGTKVVWTNRATLERGRPKLLWVTPSKPGAYSVTLAASDLAGNFSTATGTITLTKGASAH
jgi:D-glucuronyl C5-epimerase C-terminus